MSLGVRFLRTFQLVAGGLLLIAVATPSPAGAAGKPEFAPDAHRAALVAVLDAHSAGGIKRLNLFPSPINRTWVLYKAGIPYNGSWDYATGFAHWASGHWVDVYGPWSVVCGKVKTLSKMPETVRNSFAKSKNCAGSF